MKSWIIAMAAVLCFGSCGALIAQDQAAESPASTAEVVTTEESVTVETGAPAAAPAAGSAKVEGGASAAAPASTSSATTSEPAAK